MEPLTTTRNIRCPPLARIGIACFIPWNSRNIPANVHAVVSVGGPSIRPPRVAEHPARRCAEHLRDRRSRRAPPSSALTGFAGHRGGERLAHRWPQGLVGLALRLRDGALADTQSLRRGLLVDAVACAPGGEISSGERRQGSVRMLLAFKWRCPAVPSGPRCGGLFPFRVRQDGRWCVLVGAGRAGRLGMAALSRAAC